MLLIVAVVSLLRLAVGRSGGLLFPGPTACLAPSGRPGECVLPAECSGSGRVAGRKPCGHRRFRLLFCCEPAAAAQVVLMSTMPPPITAVKPDNCGRRGKGTSRMEQKVRDSRIEQNVVNGEDSRPNDWPWAAVLGQQRLDGSIKWVCGGSLLTARHVLTAAHCVFFNLEDSMVVRLGEHDLSTGADGVHQDRGLRRVARHPDYRSSVYLHDLALLELDAPVRLGETVLPVCLPAPAAPLVGRLGYVVGWGTTDATRDFITSVLQQAVVKVTPPGQCEAAFRHTAGFDARFPGGFGDGVLCAADVFGQERDACRGDSGGPLSVQYSDGRYRLAGVVSTGTGCGNPDFPGIYTRVAAYVDWILAEVNRS